MRELDFLNKCDNMHILTESDRLLMVKTELVVIIDRTNEGSEVNNYLQRGLNHQ